ncbi:MAG: hypothetical protein GY751_13460 [Bacteroidetes bacterium]|nr:hypothetical protein [Bacteroidota bacterium]
MMNDELRIGLILTIAFLLMMGCSKDEPALGDYPTVGLVSYFPFDGNIDDVMGNSTGGVNHGNASFINGKFGKGLAFNGVDQYVSYDPTIYHSSDQLTVSAWIRKHIIDEGTV